MVLKVFLGEGWAQRFWSSQDFLVGFLVDFLVGFLVDFSVDSLMDFLVFFVFFVDF